MADQTNHFAEASMLITNTGCYGMLRDATGAFSWGLAGMKAYLEHGIKLNLVADRYPPQSDAH